MSTLPPSPPSPTVATKFARGLLLRCPRCGSRGILKSWMHLADRCPRCALALERGEDHDYWIGGYAFNIVLAEGSALALALLVLILTWPRTDLAIAIGVAAAIVMPFAFFPLSRTLWLAWDLSFRPDEPGDDGRADS